MGFKEFTDKGKWEKFSSEYAKHLRKTIRKSGAI